MCLFGNKIIIASILLVIIYEFDVLASSGGGGQGSGGNPQITTRQLIRNAFNRLPPGPTQAQRIDAVIRYISNLQSQVNDLSQRIANLQMTDAQRVETLFNLLPPV
uniref:Uncharacterized protein n=1 Tax=Meloidogyne enterolobii TaxID=390850 RepID=A0A6V7V5W3_MELEN|nr:unnamed protein product [Meloidogyne enterolobii]